MAKTKRSRKDNLVGHILTPVSPVFSPQGTARPKSQHKVAPKQMYFLGFPSATTKRKEKSGKTRVMATLYVTGETSMPAFFYPKGRIEASTLEEAILGFRKRFPKEKGWTHGKTRKFPSGLAAYVGVSFLRERREGD